MTNDISQVLNATSTANIQVRHVSSEMLQIILCKVQLLVPKCSTYLFWQQNAARMFTNVAP